MSSDQTWNENETFPLFELLARKVGFTSLNTFPIHGLDSIIQFNTKSKILVRLSDDGNPARSYFDLQILILGKVPMLYKFWGEKMQDMCANNQKTSIENAVIVSQGEENIDRLLKEEWLKIKGKTTKLPTSFAKKVTQPTDE